MKTGRAFDKPDSSAESEARTSVLKSIRRSLDQTPSDRPEALAATWNTIPRDYLQSPRLATAEKLDLLEDRLRDYDAEVTRLSEDGVAAAIAAVLASRGDRSTVYPVGFPTSWLPLGGSLAEDHNLSARELDRFDGVLTTATLAIADTGSLVLQTVPGQGRRAATLVPDFHLCVVRAVDVVENVPEAFARLATTSTLPTTFISGPSATADIEMTRIKGVHGPRFLHVLLVL